MKNIKLLHSFSLDREKEVEETQSKIVDGEEVKITKKVKKMVPLQFALKKPNRRERESAEMYYAAKVGAFVKEGLLTRAMLMNKYQDSGGEITKDDAKYLHDVYMKSLQAENQLQRLNSATQKDDEAIDKTLSEIVGLRRQLVDFQSSRSLLYKDTAEAKAESRVILWLVLYLSYQREGENDEWVPLFAGSDLEDKFDAFDELSENGEDFYEDVIERISTYVTLLYLGSASTSEEFEEYDKNVKEEAESEKEDEPESEVEKEEIESVDESVPEVKAEDEPKKKAVKKTSKK